MSNVLTARKIASAAALGGGGLSALGLGLYGVMRLEAVMAKRTIGDPRDEPPPNSTGWYGRTRPGPAIKIAFLGDSAVAGYGLERVEETPGAHLASGVAEQADRRVYLACFAVVGAETGDLMDQVERALPLEPDVVVISIGGNDVTHGVRPRTSVAHLEECLGRIRATGAEVVVGTCPDLGTIRPVLPPLRQYARQMSRVLAKQQTVAVVGAGGRSVSLSSILGPEFEANAETFFGPDQFHPSAEGYAAFASVLLPTTLAALGLAPDDDTPLPTRGEGVLSLDRAASEAVRTPGTELDGTTGGRRVGVRGRLVQLRHRRRHPQGEIEKPSQELEPASD